MWKKRLHDLKVQSRINVFIGYVMGLGTTGLMYVIFFFPPSPFYMGEPWSW